MTTGTSIPAACGFDSNAIRCDLQQEFSCIFSGAICLAGIEQLCKPDVRAGHVRFPQADLPPRLPPDDAAPDCLYVATTSRVIAVIPCKPLKQDGNVCDTMRHENGLNKSHKQLILLEIPAELEPRSRM